MSPVPPPLDVPTVARLGPFDLQTPVARGAVGQIWLGRHRELGTPVAVKVPRDTQEARWVSQFRDEVRAIAGLHHPNVVWVHDTGLVDAAAVRSSGGALGQGDPWLAMEFADLGTLHDAGPTLGWPAFQRLLGDLLDGLGHAHARGVLHRDLKPANVLFFRSSDDPVPKLSDFGMVFTVEGGRPRRGGTPAFMAPEQCTGRWTAQGPWTDLYSLGCVVWWWATGAPPFTGRDPDRVQFAHLYQEPGPFVPTREVPTGLEEWVRGLLEKRPPSRPASAAAAAASLARLGGAPPDLPIADWRPRRPFQPSATLFGTGTGLYGLRGWPVVGRDAERDVLWGALRTVSERRAPGVVVLSGPAGCGCRRLAQWIGERGQEAGLAGRTLTSHAGGLAGLVASRYRTDAVTSDEVPELVREQAQGEGAPEAVASLLGVLGVGEPRGAPLDAVSEMLARHFGGGSGVVVFEHAQHDPEALALALHLLVSPGMPPVLVVLTVREEELGDPAAYRRSLAALIAAGAVHTAVGPLPPADHLALVDRLLPMSHGLVERIASRTAGNPLFAVQLVGDWVERGLLRPTAAGFDLAPGASVPLPASLGAVWSDRLDALVAPDPDRWPVLATGALLGLDVPLHEWTAACSVAGLGGPGDLVVQLLDRRLAVPVEGGARTRCTFAHPVFREAIVERLGDGPLARRLHGACAEMLAPRRGRGGHARRGEHLLRAGRTVEAARSLLLAAESALAHDRPDEARDALERRDAALVSSGTEDPDAIDGWLMWDDVLRRRGDPVGAASFRERALVRARSRGWASREAAALLASGQAIERDDPSAAVRFGEQAVAAAETCGDGGLVDRCRLAHSRWLARAGDRPGAAALLRTGLLSAGARGDADATARWAELAPEIADHTTAFRVGAQIGRYVLLEPLGQGATGVVWSAYDPKLGRRIALKVVDTAGRGADASARLQREARALAQLSHPNVVEVFDVEVADDRVLLAMEHVDGRDLTAWLAERARTVDEVVDVFCDAARGLRAAHRAGLVHRDFKPANVLVDLGGRVRLLDFGLAVRSDAPEEAPFVPQNRALALLDAPLTEVHELRGTPAYMAPERLVGRTGDWRSDQYSFGASLHEAVSGVLPFAGSTLVALTEAALAGRRRDDGRPVPRWLRAVVDRTLQADPDDRFSSMDELIAALERRTRQRIRSVLALGVAIGAAALVLFLTFRPGEVLVVAQGSAEARLRVDDVLADLHRPLRLSAGIHTLAVEAPGFVPVERVVDVRRGRSQEVVVPLVREQGRFTLEVVPDGATIDVDGVPYGSRLAGIPFPTGSHRIRVAKPGHAEIELAWEARVDSEVRGRVALPRAVVYHRPDSGPAGGSGWVGDLTGDGRSELVYQVFQRLIAVDPWTAQQLWTAELETWSARHLDLDGDGAVEVVAATARGFECWQATRAGPRRRWLLPLPSTDPERKVFGLVGPEVILAFSDDTLFAIGRDGRLLHRTPLVEPSVGFVVGPEWILARDDHATRLVEVDGRVTVVEEHAPLASDVPLRATGFVAVRVGKSTAIVDRASGRTVWRGHDAVAIGPDVDGDDVPDLIDSQGVVRSGVDRRFVAAAIAGSWVADGESGWIVGADQVVRVDGAGVHPRRMLPGTSTGKGFTGDLDGDGVPELLVPLEGRRLAVVDADGVREVVRLPGFVTGSPDREPRDRDGDGLVDVLLDASGPLVVSTGGEVWRVEGSGGGRSTPWVGDVDHDGVQDLYVTAALSGPRVVVNRLDLATGVVLANATEDAGAAIRKIAVWSSGDGTRRLLVAGDLGLQVLDPNTLALEREVEVPTTYGSPVIVERSDGSWATTVPWEHGDALHLARLPAFDRTLQVPLGTGAWGSPVQTGDQLVIAGHGARVVAIGVEDRVERWSVQLEAEVVVRDPAVADLDGDGDLEVVIGTDRGVTVIDATTGRELWTVPGRARDTMLDRSASVLAADAGGDERPELFVALGGSLVRLDATGGTVWRTPLAQVHKSHLGWLDAGDGHPAVLIGLTHGTVQAFDAQTGAVRFTLRGAESTVIEATPLAADVDGDGWPEVLVYGSDFVLRALRFPRPAPR